MGALSITAHPAAGLPQAHMAIHHNDTRAGIDWGGGVENRRGAAEGALLLTTLKHTHTHTGREV